MRSNFSCSPVLSFIFTLVATTAYAGGVSNDTCQSAQSFAYNSAVAGDSSAADTGTASSCGGNDLRDIWYVVSIPSPEVFSVVARPAAGFDPTLALFTACGSELGCLNEGGIGEVEGAVLANPDGPPIDLFIRIAGANQSGGAFTLEVFHYEFEGESEGASGSSNDECSTPDPLTLGVTDTGTTDGASQDLVPQCDVIDALDVWYVVNIPGQSTVSITVSPEAGFDPALSYFGDCRGEALGCTNDAAAGGAEMENLTNAGEESADILIRVAGANNGTGAFSIRAVLSAGEGEEEEEGASDPCIVDPDGWVYNPATEHWYKLTPPGSWFDAASSATNWCGYLVTINDAAENQWLAQQSGLLEGVDLAWIGLSDDLDENNFTWTDSSPFDYANWLELAPDGGASENCVKIQGSLSGNAGFWNDEQCFDFNPGIVERESDPGVGTGEGEGTGETGIYTADQNADNKINLSELLRVIQFFNSGGFSCAIPAESTEDGYQPGAGNQACAPYNADYNPQNWLINLSELLRVIQFFNSGGYHYCPAEVPPTEDGYCPGLL